MAKPERGLPKNFSIRVPDGPVTLGDYLDEAPRPTAVVSIPIPPAPLAMAATPLPDVEPFVRPALLQTRATPPRRQFNMSPETLRMLDDLLNHIRQHSAERDIRASEVVHALVLAAFEVQPYLDLARIPTRGKWGSSTAAALPVALKSVFQEAIARGRTRSATS